MSETHWFNREQEELASGDALPSPQSQIESLQCAMADLRAQLAACQRDKAELQAELRSWEYEPSGQLRAKLSNADIQSILDKAKEYMDQRDGLLALLREARWFLSGVRFATSQQFTVASARTNCTRLLDSIAATLANHPAEGEKI